MASPTCCRIVSGRRDNPPNSDRCPIGIACRSQLFLTPSPLGILSLHVTYNQKSSPSRILVRARPSELRRHASPPSLRRELSASLRFSWGRLPFPKFVTLPGVPEIKLSVGVNSRSIDRESLSHAHKQKLHGVTQGRKCRRADI